MRLDNKKLLLPLAISMALYGTHAIAEEATEDNVVTVTAQKRAQDEMEVPTSVSTIGSEDLQFNGANDLNDLSDMAPNFSTSGQEGYQSAIYMRGVGTWSRNIGFDTRVGVYLDGVYLGQSTALNQAMMGLQQAEVLRGPQGTFFGKNTVAGAVNLISIKPDSSETEGQIGIEIGNFGLQQLTGRYNLPLTETTAVQLSVMSNDYDGQYTNINSGTPVEVGARDTQAIRLQLTHEFSENFDMYISYDDSESSGSMLNGEALTGSFGYFDLATYNLGAYLPFPLHPASPLDPASEQPFVFNSSTTPSNYYDNNGLNITLSYETDSGATMRSITSIRESDSFYVSDTDYSPNALLHVEFADQYENTSQEFQWISADNDNFEYLGGLYFYEQEGTTSREAIPGADVGALAQVSLPDHDLLGPACTDVANAYSYCFYPDGPVFNRGTVDVSSWAAYGNLSYKLAENTHLDVGLRYTSEEKTADFLLGDVGNAVMRMAFSVGAGPVNDSFDDSFVSHSLGLRHQMGNTNLYLKWSTGFKSGGFNTDFISQETLDVGARFEKETVNSIEAGLKGRYLDNKLKLTLAIFNAKYEDYQVNQFIALGEDSSTITITNVEEANTSGLELGLNYRFNDNFSVDFGYGYLDATFGNFPGGGVRLADTTNADATGNPLPYAPEHSMSTGLLYETSLESFGGTTLIAAINHSYSSDQQATTWNVSEYTLPASGQVIPFSNLDSRSLFNIRIGLIDTEGDWDVFLWGKNVTDEEYLVESFRDFFNTYTEEHGDQRTYGIEANYYF